MSDALGLTIVGMDVRALAQSAGRAGRRVTGIDCFGDADCRSACQQLHRPDRCTAEALAEAALDSAFRGGRRGDLIVGGGLDARPELLRRLERSFLVLGNPPETAEFLADPASVFRLLDQLGIAHPAVRYRPPTQPASWLHKRTASCGGQAVTSAAVAVNRSREDGGYFQQQIRGRVVSALFAANGRDAVIIGYSRLLSQAVGDRPFSYAGAIGWTGPDQRRRQIIERWIGALTRALGLRGVNGVDLVLPTEGHAPLFLELNARPTATLELHEDRLSGGGIQCHLDACEGRLPRPAKSRFVHGARVVYAARDLRIPVMRWPTWCRDRPLPGTEIAAGNPICTVQATTADPGRIGGLLAQRTSDILFPIEHSSDQAA